jgi:transcriptional regulator with XRE-family HTH domain
MAPGTRAVLAELGLRMRELRQENGLTQEQAAERLGMLAPNYARIEQGRMNVTVETLVRLADVFEVPVRALFENATFRETRRPGRPARIAIVGLPNPIGPKRTRRRAR